MIKVLKFGGTSVGSAVNMRRVAEIIRHEGALITVLSAMSGTTDMLQEIASLANIGENGDRMRNIIGEFKRKYRDSVPPYIEALTSVVHMTGPLFLTARCFVTVVFCS